MDILAKVLQKKGKTFDQLGSRDREIFAGWENVLSNRDKKKLEIDDLKELIKGDIERCICLIENGEYEPGSALDTDIRQRLWWGRFIMRAIDSPNLAAKHLEGHLKRIFNITD